MVSNKKIPFVPKPAKLTPPLPPIFSFGTPPAPIPERAIKEIVTADIVVAGAGPAGLAAALSAAETGARVVLLEKFHDIAAPGQPGAPFLGTRLQKLKGIEIKKEDIIKRLYEAGEGRVDETLLKTWADRSTEVGDWLIDISRNSGISVDVTGLGHIFYKEGERLAPGVQFAGHGGKKIPSAPPSPAERGAGLLLLNMLADECRLKGVEIRFNTKAEQLVRPNNKGPVTGIIARNELGSYVLFHTLKAVILCTGDYGQNNEMIEKFCPWAAGIPKLMQDTVTGDGQKMGIWIGAKLEDSPHCAMIHFDSTNERLVTQFRPVGMMPEGPQRGNYLYVNKRGERFQNEDQSDEILANMVLRQPGKTHWQVFDARSVTDTNREVIEKCLETGAVLKADTVEELASQFGADGKIFKATVDRYNELVKIGKDPDFNKSSERMDMPVDKPPFYVCESPPDLLAAMGGFKRNTDGQVLDNDANVIPGLYAAGNTAGGFWGDSYPMRIIDGICRSHALVFGRLAGLHAGRSEKLKIEA